MKRTHILFLFFAVFCFAEISAQEINVSNGKWNRIESDNKEISVALPPNAVVDAEERKFGQKLKVAAFQNGVEMELQIFKDSNFINRYKLITMSNDDKFTIFRVGDFSILKMEPRSEVKKFGNSFWLTKKDSLYFVSINSKTGQEPEVARFLYSIHLQGKPIFAPKQKTDFPEETISVSSLKTTPEVIEAFGRKLEKNKINVTYEAATDDFVDDEIKGLTRQAVILERPTPVLSSNITNGNTAKLTVKLKINFLANGQIGDIAVLSVENKAFSKACLEAAQKIRFLPAQVDGKNADSVRVVEYTAQFLFLPDSVRPR